MQNRFFAMLARMKLIRRWGLMFSTRDENLSEHSLDTAFFMHALLSLHNRRFLTPGEEPLDLGTGVLLAIYHDAAEILTGDLPTPVKYSSSELRKAYQRLEQEAGERLLSLAPASLREDYRPYLMQEEGYAHRLVKAADRIAAYIKCVEERQAGNREFLAAEQTILQSIEAIDLPEVQAFFAQCVPAFGLSLDELSAGEVEP